MEGERRATEAATATEQWVTPKFEEVIAEFDVEQRPPG